MIEIFEINFLWIWVFCNDFSKICTDDNSNEKSTTRVNENKAGKSVSSTSINAAKYTTKHNQIEDDEESDEVDMDMVSATDSDVSFYVSLYGAFILIKIEFFF